MNEKKNYAIHTLGCKLNYSESSSLSRLLQEKGFEQKQFTEKADIYVLNTCSVTDNADKECKQLIRKISSQNPEAYIVVTGCYAQLKPDEIANLKGVDLVLGASEKFNLIEHIQNLIEKDNPKIHSCEIEDVSDFKSAFSFQDRTRAFLKLQDGCDYTCSYCTIPLARGKSRSDTFQNIEANIQKLEKQNIKEIVLTGVNLGDYANEGKKFVDVIRLIENMDTQIKRFRISSIEPNLLTNEIVEIIAKSKKIMPHFHLPLQSGNNEILGLMRRRYKRELYFEKINLIKSLIPDAGIGADVIVGFPNESEKHFQDTFDFIHSLDVSYLHVFTYSERQDTFAASLKPVVPMNVRKLRNKLLRNLSLKKSTHFKEQFIGQQREVLFESELSKGLIEGYTDNYIKIQTFTKPNLENTIVNWQIK